MLDYQTANILFLFIFFLNVITFGLYAWDKHCAVYGKWRIPEFLLLILPVLSAGYGAGMGMLLFRHKTRHTTFLIIVPLFFILWLAAIIFIWLSKTPDYWTWS